MNLRKSILALSVVAGIVAAPMTVFAAHTHSWGSPQYYGYFNLWRSKHLWSWDDWNVSQMGEWCMCILQQRLRERDKLT